MREWDLLRSFFRSNHQLPAGVTLPPGDDMGAIRLPESALSDPGLLVAVDQVADRLHFDLSSDTPALIGRKAVTRNLSDIAAMAARPLCSVAAAALPKHLDQALVLDIFESMRRTAAQFDCPLIGGDLSIWDQRLIISVTVLATPYPDTEPIQRHQARVGDLIVVSGRLGGSLIPQNGVAHHLDFEPRLTLARDLAAMGLPRSMVDLSDGLGRDAAHLLPSDESSAIELTAATLPISDAATEAARHSGKPAWWHALADGEDYELCFAIPADRAHDLPKTLHNVPLTIIGQVTHNPDPATRTRIRDEQGRLLDVAQLGWEHEG